MEAVKVADNWGDKKYRGRTSLNIPEALGMSNKSALILMGVVATGIFLWAQSSKISADSPYYMWNNSAENAERDSVDDEGGFINRRAGNSVGIDWDNTYHFGGRYIPRPNLPPVDTSNIRLI